MALTTEPHASKILCGCECSQVLTRAFRALGHNCYSCDLKPAYGPSANKGWHWKGDVEEIMKREGPFDLICLFPPCVYLSCVGNRWMTAKKKDGTLKYPDRQQKRDAAIAFVKRIFKEAPSPCVMLENPKGVLSTQWRQPNQRVCPTMFGDTMRKTTCLWTTGLPLLDQDKIRTMPALVQKASGETVNAWHANTRFLPQELATQIRSQLAPGFAHAIAEQYSAAVLESLGAEAPIPVLQPEPPEPTAMVANSTAAQPRAQSIHIVVQSGGILNLYK